MQNNDLQAHRYAYIYIYIIESKPKTHMANQFGNTTSPFSWTQFARFRHGSIHHESKSWIIKLKLFQGPKCFNFIANHLQRGGKDIIRKKCQELPGTGRPCPLPYRSPYLQGVRTWEWDYGGLYGVAEGPTCLGVPWRHFPWELSIEQKTVCYCIGDYMLPFVVGFTISFYRNSMKQPVLKVYVNKQFLLC